jgi:hypothetical protein
MSWGKDLRTKAHLFSNIKTSGRDLTWSAYIPKDLDYLKK